MYKRTTSSTTILSLNRQHFSKNVSTLYTNVNFHYQEKTNTLLIKYILDSK